MVLLLAVAVPLFFSAGFFIQQQVVRHQMKQELNEKLLQTVSLPADKAVWLNEKKELIIDGRLFDVASWQISNNELTATGLFDEDEDKLNKKLQQLIGQNNDSPSPLNELMADFFSLPFYSEAFDFTTGSHWLYVSEVKYNYAESIPAAPSLSDLYPPKI